MKNFIRILALLLACLFCVCCFAACKPKDDGPKGGGTDDGTHIGEDGKKYDSMGKLMDDLPDDLNYRGERIKVLYWADVEKPEFEQSEEVDDSRMSAIYNRNLAIQQRLGVSLKFSSVNGNAGNRAGFVKTVEDAMNSGLHDYDIIGTYSRTAGTMVTKNLCYDLSTVKADNYIDLEKPWWPDHLTDYMMIGKSVYFLSGDISITVIDEVHAIYFNKQLVDEQFEEEAQNEGVENGTKLLYKYVREGTWTIDKLISMSSGFYEDLDRNGTESINDRYGFVSVSYCETALYGSAGLRMLVHDDTEVLKISNDYTSARTASLVQRLGTWMSTGTVYNRTDEDYYAKPFINGNALFILQYLELAEDYLIGTDTVAHYGILPCPKYDETQPSYYSVIGNAFTIYTVFSDFDQRGDKEQTLSMFTAILECWASEGYRKTTPIVFELNMQLKYSETQDETDMCEYVRAGIVFDLGRILDAALANVSMDGSVISAAESNADWTSTYSAHYESAQNNLAEFIKALNPTD